jgi:hypothetical protein
MEGLVQVQDRTYDDWICGLTDAVLACVDDPCLRMCRVVSRLKPGLAEHLLQYALADLAANDASREFCRVITLRLSLHIFPTANDAGSPYCSTYRYFISCRLSGVGISVCACLCVCVRAWFVCTRTRASVHACMRVPACACTVPQVWVMHVNVSPHVRSTISYGVRPVTCTVQLACLQSGV